MHEFLQHLSIFYVSTLLGGKEEPLFALQEID